MPASTGFLINRSVRLRRTEECHTAQGSRSPPPLDRLPDSSFCMTACKQSCTIPNPRITCASLLSTVCPNFAILGGGGPRFCPDFSPQVPDITLFNIFQISSGISCRLPVLPSIWITWWVFTIGLIGGDLPMMRSTEVGRRGPVFVPLLARKGGVLARPLGRRSAARDPGSVPGPSPRWSSGESSHRPVLESDGPDRRSSGP
jgi:hypothetical protein